MNHGMGIVILALFLILTGCKQSEAPRIDDIIGEINTNPLVYNISLELQWVSPNPGNRWGEAGSEVQVLDYITTRITIRIQAKDHTGEDFEDVLPRLTTENLTIETMENGDLFARGISPISDYVIYRDFPDYVVTLTLLEALDDTINPIYINDWEQIALEGNLFVRE